jgi:hypothetical protein
MSRRDLQECLGVSQTTFYKFTHELMQGEMLPKGKAMRNLYDMYTKETFAKDSED